MIFVTKVSVKEILVRTVCQRDLCKKSRWRFGFLLQRVLALVMVRKAGLGKHCRSREAIGFDEGKVVDGAVHVREGGHVQGGGGAHGSCPRRKR